MNESGLRSAVTRRLTRGWLIGLDASAAAVFAVAALYGAHGSHVPWWARVSVALGIGVPVAARRRWPMPVFVLVLAACVTAEVLGTTRTWFVAPAFALYTVALTWRRRRLPTPAIAALSAGCMFGLSLAGPAYAWRIDPGPVMAAAGALGGAWTIGRTVSARRAFAAQAARDLAERAAADERLRIARELHDVVGHTMGVIAVKAAISGHVAETRPREALEALRVIEATSRDALTDMRRMLGVLRAEEEPDLRPTPGVTDLPALVERATEAGVRVALRLSGTHDLPEGVGRSVYRIVQESLTNVTRHAPASRCEVSVEADSRCVRIEVTDDGPGGSAGPDGYGLIGMRERAALHGGTVAAGPRTGGGFRVVALLPYRDDPPPGRAGVTRPLS
ncbi:sensor histidine kinase [Embleya sp. NBC_00896]|uniref:sensor histidine kinase n=1 Tax=Embleya sp. NBC_00896 TaxID=2975961 RepID=UPI002F911E76|nr:sensor histidine kinase [Embleya sp. NBC_00896]